MDDRNRPDIMTTSSLTDTLIDAIAKTLSTGTVDERLTPAVKAYEETYATEACGPEFAAGAMWGAIEVMKRYATEPAPDPHMLILRNITLFENVREQENGIDVTGRPIEELFVLTQAAAAGLVEHEDDRIVLTETGNEELSKAMRDAFVIF
jgi:hypothetical protein